MNINKYLFKTNETLFAKAKQIFQFFVSKNSFRLKFKRTYVLSLHEKFKYIFIIKDDYKKILNSFIYINFIIIL